ncbi:MAG: HAMP domain-containing sensor histidine kinase [Acidimicrobiales bacterium]
MSASAAGGRASMSLRWRIALALGGIAALVGSAAAVGSYVATDRQVRSELDRSLLQLEGRINPNGMREGGELRTQPPERRSEEGDRDDLRSVGDGCPTAAVQPSDAAQVVRADGSVTACYPDGLALPVDDGDLAQAAEQGAPRLRTVTIDGRDYRLAAISWHHGGVVQVARSFAEPDAVLRGLQLRLSALVAAAVLAAAAAGWWFAKHLVRPLERLRSAAQQVASTGDLTVPVPAGGAGEVGSLAASFTTMMQGLALSREQQKRLVADAGHELRTPLTSLRTNIELLQRAHRLPEGERDELLADVRAELEELTELVEELVELATDRSGADAVSEPVRLGEVAEVVVARARRRSGRAIELVEHHPVEVAGVRPQLERAVSNLVDNALKYSAAPVTVVVEGASVEVRDRGPGVAAEDKPHVFERFYRATAARTAAGSGLGLAIVAQVVERHGGRVWVADEPGGGARVGFALPVPPPAP